MTCGHRCQAKCGEPHTSALQCRARVQLTGQACGHQFEAECRLRDIAKCSALCGYDMCIYNAIISSLHLSPFYVNQLFLTLLISASARWHGHQFSCQLFPSSGSALLSINIRYRMVILYASDRVWYSSMRNCALLT